MSDVRRRGAAQRKTKETEVEVQIDLDGAGSVEISTGLPFFDHMLTLTAVHGLFDLNLSAKGDLEVDGHHTIEDIGLTLGRALAEAWGQKKGLARFGEACVPMDEALARAVVDLSGRPHLAYRVAVDQEMVGRFEVALVREFFQGLVNEAKMTLHLEAWHGSPAHHVIEAVFKAFGRALAQAASLDPRRSGVPSTKGVL